MKIRNILSLLFLLHFLSGCTTGTVVNLAKDKTMGTAINKVHEAYKDKNSIYICFNGHSYRRLGTRDFNGKNTIERNNDVFLLKIKEGEYKDKKYNYVESDEIVSTNCSDFKKEMNLSSSSLTIYDIRTEQTCGFSKKSCNPSPIDWEVHLKNTSNRKGSITSDKYGKYNESVIADVVSSFKKENINIKNTILLVKNYYNRSEKHKFTNIKNSIYYIDSNDVAYNVKMTPQIYKRGIYPLYILTPLTVVVDVVTFPIQYIIAKESFDSSF